MSFIFRRRRRWVSKKRDLKCPVCMVSHMHRKGCGCWGCDICGTLLRPHFNSAQVREQTLLGYFLLEGDLDFEVDLDEF